MHFTSKAELASLGAFERFSSVSSAPPFGRGGTGNLDSIQHLTRDDILPLPDEEGYGGEDIARSPDTGDGETNLNLDGDATSYGGQDGELWLQDTRHWKAVHGVGKLKQLNLLFADGSTKAITDLNGDGYINPGFPVNTTLDPVVLKNEVGYRNNRCEFGPADFFNGPFLDNFLILICY